MCGIPVAGFNIGGMPEMVSQANGALSDQIGPEELLTSIKIALKISGDKNRISKEAGAQFSSERQAGEFMELAKSMLVNPS
jgi:hypothetical protein